MNQTDNIKEQLSKKYSDLWFNIVESNSSDLPTLQDLFEYAIDEYISKSKLKDEELIINSYILISKRLVGIAETYHDRLVMSGSSGFNRKCDCCSKEVTTTTSIEHDSRDYSKDLSVCADCYSKIVEYWKINKPNKIAPI